MQSVTRAVCNLLPDCVSWWHRSATGRWAVRLLIVPPAGLEKIAFSETTTINAKPENLEIIGGNHPKAAELQQLDGDGSGVVPGARVMITGLASRPDLNGCALPRAPPLSRERGALSCFDCAHFGVVA